MSASEKLKALGAGFDRVTPIMRKIGPRMAGADAFVHAKDIHAYVNVLPQIVAVIESAERETGMEADTEEARMRQIPRLRDALSALEEALS